MGIVAFRTPAPAWPCLLQSAAGMRGTLRLEARPGIVKSATPARPKGDIRDTLRQRRFVVRHPTGRTRACCLRYPVRWLVKTLVAIVLSCGMSFCVLPASAQQASSSSAPAAANETAASDVIVV